MAASPPSAASAICARSRGFLGAGGAIVGADRSRLLNRLAHEFGLVGRGVARSVHRIANGPLRRRQLALLIQREHRIVHLPLPLLPRDLMILLDDGLALLTHVLLGLVVALVVGVRVSEEGLLLRLRQRAPAARVGA